MPLQMWMKDPKSFFGRKVFDEYNDPLLASEATMDEGLTEKLPGERRAQSGRRPLNRALSVVFYCIIVGLSLWGVANIGRNTINISIISPKQRSCSCGGTTVAEAIRRGCIFTPLAIAWLPPHCIDMELAEEFDRAGPEEGWPYWADVNGTIPLTREEVSYLADTKGGVFYSSQDWHLTHCMYTWKKHFRSKTTGVTIENRSNGIKHIDHCEGIVRDGAPLEKIWTMAGIELNADLV